MRIVLVCTVEGNHAPPLKKLLLLRDRSDAWADFTTEIRVYRRLSEKVLVELSDHAYMTESRIMEDTISARAS